MIVLGKLLVGQCEDRRTSAGKIVRPKSCGSTKWRPISSLNGTDYDSPIIFCQLSHSLRQFWNNSLNRPPACSDAHLPEFQDSWFCGWSFSCISDFQKDGWHRALGERMKRHCWWAVRSSTKSHKIEHGKRIIVFWCGNGIETQKKIVFWESWEQSKNLEFDAKNL